MLSGSLGEDKGAISDIHLVLILKDVILPDPDSIHLGGR
jgi:hypothetical protein